jgi:hypothetical protein
MNELPADQKIHIQTLAEAYKRNRHNQRLTSVIKLSPCPFCLQNEAGIEETEEGYFFAECAVCNEPTELCGDEDEAIAQWEAFASDAER